MTKISSITAAAIALFAMAGTANAALISCPASFTADGTAKVHDGTGQTAASACEYLTPADNSNVANATNVNAAGFFGFTDWAGIVGALQLENGGATGTWSIPGVVDFAQYDYMLTFKDGRGTNLTSFLLNEEFSSGAWSTPFAPGIYDLEQTKDVSHYSLFRRLNPTEVPEPSTLALFSLGLLGLAFAVRRRRSN